MNSGEVTIILDESRDYLASRPSGSFDACVTDPPYEIGFMGRKWDSSGIAYNVERWAEILRILKPGAHLLAFSSTRTYHRMVCAIEDAGFEIRDQIGWMYGTGFPKSLDVAKAIDKNAGHWRGRAGNVLSGNDAMSGGNYERTAKGEAVTEMAKLWEGWGTALKPSWEPICVARKPIVGTVVENVLAHGTGALNIDASRVPSSEALGRWPANIIHDGSEQALSSFPEKSGGASLRAVEAERGGGGIWTPSTGRPAGAQHADSGSAARFFYCAKPSQAEREGNDWPTVKPVALMRYLVKLVTPPGGSVIDPFLGSGSTAVACMHEGFNCTGVDIDPHAVELAMARVQATANALNPA